jgi:RNA polymerase sigma factor (sigma-70 family)
VKGNDRQTGTRVQPTSPKYAFSERTAVCTISESTSQFSDELISVSTSSKTEQEFDRIMSAYGQALSRLTFGYEKVGSAREELMQEIALAIWQALPNFRGECSERTFLYRIAHNCAITHVCRRRPADESLEELPSPLEPVDPKPHPEEQFARTHQRDRLRSAIQRLPLVFKQVLMLMLEDLSQAEIAEVLGITENNVAVRLNRARNALKAEMGVAKDGESR